jgi:glycosyltransferase involved in cell wall biosynthesis
MTMLSALRRARLAEAPPARDLRVLIMSHSDPRLTRGGAEISAGALCTGLSGIGAVKTWFMGATHTTASARLGANLTQPFGAQDFLYQPGAPFEHFHFANRDPLYPKMLEELITDLQPDIVHAHHYTVFGVETFPIIKRAAPDCRVVVTLHEFLAICHNHGQMVKRSGNRLCNRDSPLDCARCFPDKAPRDFFLRKHYIQTMLRDVDMFISPSAFLAERYIAWGVPASRMQVLENMPPPPGPARRVAGGAARTQGPGQDVHIGFFGQMSPLKGVTTLIEAARDLAAAGIDNLVIDLYGDYSNQPPDFQAMVVDALKTADANVHYHGPYDNADVLDLMNNVDAVIVPSIWWENSPVVIQEALQAGKPVICSNIGGMAEKVRPGLDGLHFAAGQPRALARLLKSIANHPEMLDDIAATIRPPWAAEDALRAHLELYRSLIPAAATH